MSWRRLKLDELRSEVAQRSSWITLIGNTVLAGLKIFGGLFTGSAALLADGVDTGTDIFTSAVTLLAVRISSKPPDASHPYGHGRAETISAIVVALVMLGSGVLLLAESVLRIVRNEFSQVMGLTAMSLAGISIVGKLGLFLYSYTVGKRIKSSVIIANALNMRNDVMISSAVFVGLFGYTILNVRWLDTAFAAFVAVMILKTGLKIIKDAGEELMDGVKGNCEIYSKIINAIRGMEDVTRPHKIRARKSGNLYFVDLDIEVDPKMTVERAHKISHEVVRRIKEADQAIVDVVVHVEPMGSDRDEAYGVDEENLPRS